MRTSGILLAVTSLPSEYGIGTLGEGAFRFVDFLSRSGQYYWQILPLNPPGYGNSPYQAHSAFAGNHFLLDPGLLKKEGLLSSREEEQLRAENTGRVDYGLFNSSRLKTLKLAANRLKGSEKELAAFERENAFWLFDYCRYMALKEQNDMLPPEKWRVFTPDEKSCLSHRNLQFLFFSQWQRLKNYANENGLHVIGDIPIYVSADSADFYTERKIFQVDEVGNPSFVAGCPPDSFAKEGQLWGNPLYEWEKARESVFSWWMERFSQAQRMFDVVRIDHFRGFYEYYSVPAGSRNAVDGKWKKAPGLSFVNAVKASFPSLGIIAEDLGFLTKETKAFFEKSGFPGMKILQFAFDGKNSEYLPHNHEKNSVVYTGTHDNKTLLQWQRTESRETLLRAMDYLGAKSPACLADCFIKAALRSTCETAVIPIQDWLKKGEEGRMNTPSTVKNNWEFRVRQEELSLELSRKILYYTTLFCRKHNQEEPK